MARITLPLSDTQIKQAKPKEKEYILWDGLGLGLKVKSSGTKSWIYNYYTPFTKKRTNIGLGRYGNTKEGMSLKKARLKRELFRDLLAQDIDPKEYRKAQQSNGKFARENTFEVVYRNWLSTKDGNWSDSYRKRLTQALELHIIPALGPIPISKITAPEAIKVLGPIADRQALETVRKLCRWINEIMVFATNTGLVDANCLSGIAKAFKPPAVKNMPSIHPDQLPKFLKDLEESGASLTTKSLIRWLLHTQARPAEGAKARWDEIDWDNRMWNIDACRMKKRRPHSVPLTEQSIQILETMQPISFHRDYIFPSRSKPRKHMNTESANTAMKRLGYRGVFVSHGIRALASTVLNEQEFPADIIEVSQSRVGGDSVRAVYNRSQYIEQRRKMMQWWSKYIECAENGERMRNNKKHLSLIVHN